MRDVYLNLLPLDPDWGVGWWPSWSGVERHCGALIPGWWGQLAAGAMATTRPQDLKGQPSGGPGGGDKEVVLWPEASCLANGVPGLGQIRGGQVLRRAVGGRQGTGLHRRLQGSPRAVHLFHGIPGGRGREQGPATSREWHGARHSEPELELHQCAGVRSQEGLGTRTRGRRMRVRVPFHLFMVRGTRVRGQAPQQG